MSDIKTTLSTINPSFCLEFGTETAHEVFSFIFLNSRSYKTISNWMKAILLTHILGFYLQNKQDCSFQGGAV